MSQDPQKDLLEDKFTQDPLQQVNPVEHFVPQDPQLFESVFKLLQTPLQLVSV